MNIQQMRHVVMDAIGEANAAKLRRIPSSQSTFLIYCDPSDPSHGVSN
jgi:hypothetical protein